jgi:hypothetical protein
MHFVDVQILSLAGSLPVSSYNLTGAKDDICSLSRQKWEESMTCFFYHTTCVCISQIIPAFSGQNISWTLKNKRPERLKDSLTEVEV